MKKYLFVSLFVLILTLPVFSQRDVNSLDDPLRSLKSHGKYDEAILDLNNLIRENPNDPKLYAKRAEFLQLQDKLEDAIADLDKAISIEPENAKFYIQRAEYFNLAGNNQTVLKDVKTAVQLNTDKRGILIDGTKELFKSEQFGEIIKIADFYISRTDSNSQSKDWLVYDAYKIRSKAKSAIKDYEGAVQDNIKSIELLPITGVFEKDFSASIEIGFSQYEEIKSVLLHRLNDDEKVFYYYNKTIDAAEKKLKDFDYYFQERANQEQRFRQTYISTPNASDLSRLTDFMIPLAYHYAKKGQSEKGIEVFERVIKLQPHWNNQLKRARFFRYIGKHQEAIEQLTAIIAVRDKPISDVLIERSEIYALTKQYEKAIADYETVIALYPENEVFLRAKISDLQQKMQ